MLAISTRKSHRSRSRGRSEADELQAIRTTWRQRLTSRLSAIWRMSYSTLTRHSMLDGPDTLCSSPIFFPRKVQVARPR